MDEKYIQIELTEMEQDKFEGPLYVGNELFDEVKGEVTDGTNNFTGEPEPQFALNSKKFKSKQNPRYGFNYGWFKIKEVENKKNPDSPYTVAECFKFKINDYLFPASGFIHHDKDGNRVISIELDKKKIAYLKNKGTYEKYGFKLPPQQESQDVAPF